MLHEFLTLYREAIITRTRDKLTNRPWPLASTSELEHGVPLFLTQLGDALKIAEADSTIASSFAIGASGTLHGRALKALGFNLSQVVHDYGDICQAITEIALEEHAPVTTEEFHTLNRCLDNATAEAVMEHGRITAAQNVADETVRLGQVGHELRNLVSTALFAFQTLRQGYVAVNGSTGLVLGRTLMNLRDTVASTLCEVRLTAGIVKRERVQLSHFINEIAVVANLHAEYSHIRLRILPVDTGLYLDADAQVLTSAIMNLLSNAFKFTKAKGQVTLRAYRRDEHLLIEVADECGGFANDAADPFAAFVDRRAADRTGLGLGLSIARKAVHAHGGTIRLINMPGKGCVFEIDIPLSTASITSPIADT